MDLFMHPSVQKVAEFMQRELPAEELKGVINALVLVAPAIWAHYPSRGIAPITLRDPAITETSQQQSTAT